MIGRTPHFSFLTNVRLLANFTRYTATPSHLRWKYIVPAGRHRLRFVGSIVT